MDSGRTVSYAYDSLYRVTSAVTNGSANYVKWGLSWSYDRYGNRLGQSSSYDTPPTNSVSVDATTNRITGSPYAYDANGNMTNDGNNTLAYDAENRVLSATNGGAAGTYTYDGNSLRVKKVSGSTTTVYIFSRTKVIAEYDNGAAVGSPSREYIYSGGALLAKIDSSGTKYYHPDHLSNRLITDSNGSTVTQLGHFPFGESWYNATNDKLQFTTYERDAESGNDYAMMRYGVNRLARFSSPDPLSGSLGDPQSLNKYPYALNDPGNLIDPLGLCGGGPGGVSSGIITGDTFRGTWTSTGPEQSFTSAPCPGDDPAGPSYGMQSIYGGGAGGLSASEVPLHFMRNLGGGADRGGGGSSRGSAQLPAPSISPAAQACVNQANQQVQNQLRTFSGYAGTKLIGRAALGAFSGAMTSFWRFSKTGNPWVVATGATVGAAIGAGSSMYFDSRTIQKIQNSFMDKFVACMQSAFAPKPPE